MKITTREKRLLAVLGAFAGLFALRFLWSASAPPPAPGVGAARGRATAPRGRRAEELPESVGILELAALDREPHDFHIGRDPFRYGEPPPPPPPPPPTKEELERRRLAEEERLRRLEEQRRLDAIPKPPPVTLTYLGSFGPEQRRIAVFADAGGENLYNARAGDVLEGKFIVDRIGYESVDLKFVEFPDEPAKRLAIGG